MLCHTQRVVGVSQRQVLVLAAHSRGGVVQIDKVPHCGAGSNRRAPQSSNTLYLTYRSQVNAPDVFNRFLNQVKMPTVQGEHANYVRATLAIAVANAYTLYCAMNTHVTMRDFVAQLGNELL